MSNIKFRGFGSAGQAFAVLNTPAATASEDFLPGGAKGDVAGDIGSFGTVLDRLDRKRSFGFILFFTEVDGKDNGYGGKLVFHEELDRSVGTHFFVFFRDEFIEAAAKNLFGRPFLYIRKDSQAARRQGAVVFVQAEINDTVIVVEFDIKLSDLIAAGHLQAAPMFWRLIYIFYV